MSVSTIWLLVAGRQAGRQVCCALPEEVHPCNSYEEMHPFSIPSLCQTLLAWEERRMVVIRFQQGVS